MSDKALVLGFPEYLEPARRLATALGAGFSEVTLHHFPDGESRIQLPEQLPAHLILCRSLHQPNDKLLELLFTASAARRSGAQRITLVAPYLCYMRQDKAFHPGEVISQRELGELLAHYFDALLTVDTHLHRVSSLPQAIPLPQAVNISACQLMAEFLARTRPQAYLLGPDSESRQWVAAIAQQQQLAFGVASKERLGDRKVEVKLPDDDFAGRDVVLVDDMASTGQTLLEAVRQLRERDVARLSVLVTHPLFIDNADQRLLDAGVDAVWSCDTIAHRSNQLELATELAAALRTMQQA